MPTTDSRIFPIRQSAKYYSQEKLGISYNNGVAVDVEKKPFDALRARLLDRANELGVSLRELSEAIGKNHAYMHQFVYRGSPQKLDEADRAIIAAKLHWAETDLGGPERAGSLVLKTGELTEAQVTAALGPILSILGIERPFWAIAAKGLLKAIEAAQSLDQDTLLDRDYEIAGRVVAAELLKKRR